MNYGLMIDIRSIQDYVFSSNRLKDNIGASYLVSHFFDGLDGNSGISGGGNLFLLCKSDEECKQIVRDLSLRCLDLCPGLSFSAVWDSGFDDVGFEQSYERLVQKLQKEKSSRYQINTVPSYGINAQCPQSGLSSVYSQKGKEDGDEWLSEVVLAKRNASDKASEKLQNDYGEVLLNKYAFADSLDRLGISKGHESFISVVYIDGNDVGAKFEKLRSFKERWELSRQIVETNKQAMKDVIAMCIDKLETDWKSIYRNRLSTDNGKVFLPLRPLFIGGDDVCFVCEGRLGIVLALEYMAKMREYLKEEGFSSCAGVAMAKYNYPFFQIHKLAESLCRNAKRKRLQDNSQVDYLDFQLISSAVSIPLSELRTSQYVLGDGRELSKRPYSVDDLGYLMQGARNMKSKWPGSKIKELRAVLYQSERQQNSFLEQVNARGRYKLFCKGLDSDGRMFSDDKTIYLDMIELMEMIPVEGSQ